MSPSFKHVVSSARLASVGAVALILAPPAISQADTLADAIALAYDSNPTLVSQRAQLQATDENYVQAEAGFRPTVSSQASASYSKAPEASLFGGSVETETNTGSVTISVNQPLYSGGRTTAEVRAADAQIRAGREQLRSVEASVLLGVITAYSDVLRDRSTLSIQRTSLKALSDAVDEIRARHEAGAATITDVSQAEAQLETGRSLVSTAQAQLEISNAGYISVVGRSPGDLALPPPLPDIPETVDRAFDVSAQENPSIRQAQFAEAQTRAQVQEAKAGFRPTVSITGTLGYSGAIEPFDRRDYQRDVGLSATVNQPIFTGGMLSSQVRQALAQNTAARVQVSIAQRSVIQSVSQAWSQRRAAQLNTVSQTAAVRAAQATFEGMRVEYRAGLRATLDVLIAQETLRDAQVALASANHDKYVADASLLSAIGRLEAQIIVQDLPIYRPETTLRSLEHVGDVPWSSVPRALDHIGNSEHIVTQVVPGPPRSSVLVQMTPPVQGGSQSEIYAETNP